MLIEIYKGIEINHNANTDEFYTSIIINTKSNGKKEYITAGRLQKIRDDIDKFLNTAAKKPFISKAWKKGKYNSEKYELVDIIILSAITGGITYKQDGRLETTGTHRYSSDDPKLFLKCKENDAIIENLNKKQAEINKIEKEISCSSGKLLPLKNEHFK